MSRDYGISDPTGRLRRVLVRPPDDAFAVADPSVWHYGARPDARRAAAEHRRLVEILMESGAEVVIHDDPLPDLADSVFVFDPVFMTPVGAVLLRMGKSLRRGEEAPLGDRLEQAGVPIVGRLRGPGKVEGGDLLRLDATTVVAGLGFRTDRAGCDELTRILADLGCQLHPFDLPYLGGPSACLHLRSLVSLLAPDLAVAHRALLPVRLWRLLEERYEVVDVPPEELASMGPNVLALAPRRCLVLEGSPRTRDRLRRAGCEVLSYRRDEISHKAEGGPTCLTLPLWREASA